MVLAEFPGRKPVCVQTLSLLLCCFMVALKSSCYVRSLLKKEKIHVIIPVSWTCKSLSRIRLLTGEPISQHKLKFCSDITMAAFIW